ncbi:hypothetical protein Nmel_010571, partial [Mimus melanotis]
RDKALPAGHSLNKSAVWPGISALETKDLFHVASDYRRAEHLGDSKSPIELRNL